MLTKFADAIVYNQNTTGAMNDNCSCRCPNIMYSLLKYVRRGSVAKAESNTLWD
ncbi:hypothetical protein CHITON_1176 [Thermococcus chitonophagus]|uniref:Uncharacterized protein n=1 Tax=Thermococcus chitonophagus TaxID=54262 RepID=A0A160VSG2_9EURY|nr:hypothetical protein CHITON_1176 [Thermococcus chitonophagus]